LLRDKLFFFGGYQGRIEKSNPPETVSFVPTAAMLAGDFTAIAAPGCSGRQITLSPGAGFSNNTISPSAFSPIALQFLQHVPVSNDPCGRLQYGIPNNNTEHQTLTRADYTVNTSQTLFARYMCAVYDNRDLRRHEYDDPEPTGQNNKVHSLVTGHNWILSSAMVNAFTYLEPHDQRSADAAVARRPTSARRSHPQPGYMG
jgi:hypothetical protein